MAEILEIVYKSFKGAILNMFNALTADWIQQKSVSKL